MMCHLRLRLFSAIALCIALPLNSAAADSSVPGGIYTYQVPEQATSITFEGKAVMRLANTVFVGIPMSTEPGTHELNYIEAGGTKVHKFEVVNKQYTEQHLTIANQAMVDPPAETLARIREESARQRRLYNSFSDTADLSLGFIKPLQGITTSLFGHRRFSTANRAAHTADWTSPRTRARQSLLPATVGSVLQTICISTATPCS